MKYLAEVTIGISNNKDKLGADEIVIAENEIRKVTLENVLVDTGVTGIVVPLGTKYR